MRPINPRLDHWFQPHVQEALAALTHQISGVQDVSQREALQVALSSIIVRVSNQESDTRYAAMEKNVSADDVFRLFSRAALALDGALCEFIGGLPVTPGRARIVNRDILSVTPDELGVRAGLVITSPPYPNAYEYWLYHKYRMYWLGMDPIAVREREIGARPHYHKVNGQDEHDFERQMGAVFGLLAEVMLPQAKACFIVGRSIIRGRLIDNVKLLIDASAQHGFVLWDAIERQIPARRKSFNPVNSRINREHLVVFSLETPTCG